MTSHEARNASDALLMAFQGSPLNFLGFTEDEHVFLGGETAEVAWPEIC